MAIEIDKILKERENLLQRLETIQAFLVSYDAMTGTKLAQNDTSVSEDDLTYKQVNIGRLSETRARRLIPAEIAVLSERLIRKNGEPMKRGDLVKEIESMGYEIRSSDKNRYVGTILWRHRDKFDNIDGYGYWVRDMGPPPNMPEWHDTFLEYKKLLGMD